MLRRVATLLVVCPLALGQITLAASHGALDQAMDGDPACNAFNFESHVSQAGGQRQEFVPSAAALAAVEVCVAPESVATPIEVVVRKGSALAPAAVIASAWVDVASLGYAHADFAAVVPVTPGERLVIEIVAAAPVRWYGSPALVDQYAGGASNAPDVVADFAFRTFSGALPPTATPTRTRTPTRTATASPTATRTPTASATVPVSTVETGPSPQSEVAGSSAQAPAVRRAAASPRTPAPGVLSARRTGRITLPNVGSGAQDQSHALRLSLVASLAALLAFAVAANPRP